MSAVLRASFLLLAMLAGIAWAAGSHPSADVRKDPPFQGKVEEWTVPTPEFARDHAAAPDGGIFISVMYGDKIARFDPKTQTFKEWDLPRGARPHALLVAEDGTVWYAGNGTIGHLDPTSGKVTEHKTPLGSDPHMLASDGKGNIWFTAQNAGKVGRFDTVGGKFTQYKIDGRAYGMSLDKSGNVWVCRMAADKLARIDPKSGRISEFDTGQGSAPRRMATAPDGSLWVTLFGNGKLLRFDPVAGKKIREYDLPGGKRGGPYAVTVDGAGVVWTSEINTDLVVRLDPASSELRTVKLPTENTGIRRMIVDARGKLWYMGSDGAHLGMVE